MQTALGDRPLPAARSLAATTVVVSLMAHVLIASSGWHRDLADAHGFRQTQTAMGARSIARGGAIFDYEVAVLGPPWALPFEFPLYQYAVAAVHRSAGIPLAQAGRLVSLAAFYLCLIPCYRILRAFGVSSHGSALGISFVLASPLYVFWSRAFLIESTALLLALLFVAGSISVHSGSSRTVTVLTVIVGALAAAVKITTFALGWGLVALWLLTNGVSSDNSRRLISGWLPRLSILVLPLAAGVGWTTYADHVKSRNPAGKGLTSTSLQEWNFGTFDQRTAVRSLRIAAEYGLGNVAGRLLLPVAVGLALWYLQRKHSSGDWMLLVAFAAGPLVFTNLYLVHDYYWYAAGVYLLLWVGVQFGRFLDGRRRDVHRVLAWCLAWAVLVVVWVSEGHRPARDWMQPSADHSVALGQRVAELVPPDRVIVVLGDDWDPTLPYYADRRAIMLPRWIDLEDYLLDAVRRTEASGGRIGAVILTGDYRSTEVPREVAALDGINFRSPAYEDRRALVFVR